MHVEPFLVCEKEAYAPGFSVLSAPPGLSDSEKLWGFNKEAAFFMLSPSEPILS
jgi:hypothetical protein